MGEFMKLASNMLAHDLKAADHVPCSAPDCQNDACTRIGPLGLCAGCSGELAMELLGSSEVRAALLRAESVIICLSGAEDIPELQQFEILLRAAQPGDAQVAELRQELLENVQEDLAELKVLRSHGLVIRPLDFQ
ncbi:MAG TPA: hypothetical protein VGK74_11795 [Symbiobacteriaceae bacterium]|jgi:hypothetical protein